MASAAPYIAAPLDASMGRVKNAIADLFAKDRLTADDGSVWKDAQGQWRKRRVLKLSGSSGFFALCLFLAIASIGLPLPGRVNDARAEATSLYARDGKTLLYKIRGEKNRSRIDFSQMPKCIKDATVATEDKSFYKHQGLDPRGMARALIVNLEFGQTSQGGSTITQQLVKNALLSPERTYTRKAKELILSLEIEQMLSKDEILKLYLNEIPYGHSAYGIEAASQTYFAKPARRLTLPECATLAALPQAPSLYSPYIGDKKLLRERTLFVLEQMQNQKYIDQAERDQATVSVKKGLQFAAARGEDIKAPHFVFYVRQQLERELGVKAIQEGGYKVITTLDPKKQDIAEDVVTQASGNFGLYGASNAALTAVNPKTGQIEAMVGSVDFFDTKGDGNVNVATANRQPGSSFKPIVYLAAFKKGQLTNLEKPLAMNPTTLLWDVKTDFGGGYAPNNYDRTFRGPISARDALQQSLNVPAVKVLDLIGVRTATDLAHQMGITTLNDPDRYGLSLVLGGGEVKLLELTSAYNVIANQGVAAVRRSNPNGTHTTATAILKVTDREKKDVTDDITGNFQKGDEVVSKDLAYQISDVLSDDPARAPQFGSGGPLTLPGRPDTAAKTGTTDSYRDAWTVGFTPQLSAGVWVGNNDNTPMNEAGGSRAAAPIWHDFMVRVLADKPVVPFERPEGIKELRVDRLTGLLPGRNTRQTKSDLFTDSNAPKQRSDAGVGIDKTECKPRVSLNSPSGGTIDSGSVSISATATTSGDGPGIAQVSFNVDGRVIATDTAPPFSTATTLSGGSHTITATARSKDCSEGISGESRLHSERPNNPNWEKPVQAWIRGHGLSFGQSDNTETATDSVRVTVGSGETPTPEPSPTDGGGGDGGGGALGPGSLTGYLRDDQLRLQFA
ncbi:MAG: PBP1A family penicillin-binding protein [Patescibacteria group bacterium]|nr:PBP1A family penicillin-binding protein [Patescibacteria group bacterium]